MKKILLVFSLVFMFILSPVSAKDTYIDTMTITAILDDKGDAHIKEVWKMSVYEGTEVYKVMDNMNNKRITNFKVNDGNNQYSYISKWDVDASFEEKRNKCGLIRDNDRYELCFGIGEYGIKTYTFEYDVSHFVEQYNGDQGFNFAFFSDLSLDINKAMITIEYKNFNFTDDNSDIYAYGYEGYVDYSNGKIVMGTHEPLEDGSNKMQILMRIDNGSFVNLSDTDRTFNDILEEAEDENDFPWEIILVIVGFVLFIVVIVVVVTMNKTKEEIFEDGTPFKIHEDSVPSYNRVPCDSIFRFYYLADKIGLIGDDKKSGLVSAILFKWIRDGIIVFEKIEGTKGFFNKSDNFNIDLNGNITLDNPFEEELMSFIKDSSGKDYNLESGEFEYWCRKHYDLIDAWFDGIKESVENELKHERLIKVNHKIHKHFGKIDDKYEEVVYSMTLKDEMEKVAGFKKYLEQLSTSAIKNIDIKQWEEYLIYANVLGLAEETEKIIKEEIPHFSQHSHINIYYHTHMIRSFSSDGIQAASTASASVSGGGGGFSGGGGGGVR